MLVRRSLLVALVAAAVTAVSGTASADTPRYRVTELGSLGGSSSSGIGINDRNWVSGSSDLAGGTITHAALWRQGRTVDLGTLGGENSAVVFPGHNNGFVIGVAETATVDPDQETWSCAYFFVGAATGHTCRGFVWRQGHMRALPTLGGPNGFAAGANRIGQVVGWAENTHLDPTCAGDQVRQFRAVRWDAHSYRPHELRPLRVDSTSAATAINDRGQVVGISGACGIAVGGVSARHAVMWDRYGRPRPLGDLGGDQWNTPVAVTNRGLVVGFANTTAGAGFHPVAFAWTARTGMRPLPALPGDEVSEALGANDVGQIVGESCGAGFAGCHAVLWQDGEPIDLNSVAGTPGVLTDADDINDAGLITGTMTGDGGTRAFVAVPAGCSS